MMSILDASRSMYLDQARVCSSLINCRSGIQASVKEDVHYLRAHPLIRKGMVITGAVYDIETGKVTQVASA